MLAVYCMQIHGFSLEPELDTMIWFAASLRTFIWPDKNACADVLYFFAFWAKLLMIAGKYRDILSIYTFEYVSSQVCTDYNMYLFTTDAHRIATNPW